MKGLGSSGSQSNHAAKPQLPTERQACTVPCDLCSTPFVLPPEIVAQGRIYGLLVCGVCIEDQLQSRTETTQ